MGDRLLGRPDLATSVQQIVAREERSEHSCPGSIARTLVVGWTANILLTVKGYSTPGEAVFEGARI
jgi:hypothetical protein